MIYLLKPGDIQWLCEKLQAGSPSSLKISPEALRKTFTMNTALSSASQLISIPAKSPWLMLEFPFLIGLGRYPSGTPMEYGTNLTEFQETYRG